MVKNPLCAFTFVEVLLVVLVIGMGLLSVSALVIYGGRLSSRSQSESIAMATAVSVANDPTPLLDPVIASDWSPGSYSFDATGPVSATTTGFINGVYVKRIESSTAGDILARSAAGKVYARSVLVDVSIYDTFMGSEVASFTTRLIRQRKGP